MRTFSIVLTLVLVAAVIVPMYLKDPSGKPIMSADDWIPETPEPIKAQAPMYKWQDADGVWQFGEAPPDDATAELIELDTDRITRLGDDWNVEPLVQDGESEVGARGKLDQLMELMPH